MNKSITVSFFPCIYKEVRREIIMIRMIGTPVREGGIMGRCVGKDKSGKVNTLYMNFTQAEKPLAMVALNMDTLEAKTYRAPRDAGAWGSFAASDGCIYIGTYG